MSTYIILYILPFHMKWIKLLKNFLKILRNTENFCYEPWAHIAFLTSKLIMSFKQKWWVSSKISTLFEPLMGWIHQPSDNQMRRIFMKFLFTLNPSHNFSIEKFSCLFLINFKLNYLSYTKNLKFNLSINHLSQCGTI